MYGPVLNMYTGFARQRPNADCSHPQPVVKMLQRERPIVMLVAACLMVIGFIGGCSSPTCSLVARAGLQIDVVDSATGQPLTVQPRLVLNNGVYSDTLPRAGDGSYDGRRFVVLFGQTGTFTATVLADGYQQWAATSIEIPSDKCGAPQRTVTLVAKLQQQ